MPELVTPILSPEQATIEAAWANSPHANTYNLEKGPNTYCARCHSPENWDSTAKIDSPPNCLSCKFPNESQVRIASSNSLVSQEDWKNIGCEICHNVQNGVVSPQIAWLDVITDYHEAISQPDQLCIKCHMDTTTLKHGIDMGNQVHAGFRCIDCHNPHSTAASCVSSGCHEDLENTFVEKTSPVYHSSIHAVVDCIACHDASGMKIIIPEGTTTWTTYRIVQSVRGPANEVYTSHNLQKIVSCQKCHFLGNPYGLLESVNP